MGLKAFRDAASLCESLLLDVESSFEVAGSALPCLWMHLWRHVHRSSPKWLWHRRTKIDWPPLPCSCKVAGGSGGGWTWIGTYIPIFLIHVGLGCAGKRGGWPRKSWYKDGMQTLHTLLFLHVSCLQPLRWQRWIFPSNWPCWNWRVLIQEFNNMLFGVICLSFFDLEHDTVFGRCKHEAIIRNLGLTPSAWKSFFTLSVVMEFGRPPHGTNRSAVAYGDKWKESRNLSCIEVSSNCF